MQIADLWLHQAGFAPGRRMRIPFTPRNSCLTISSEPY
ncbi:hypothetical protein [Trinickia fusca]|uniref:Type I addiction module toxin, SymE family n=1 Tax=Trinickia fusca TaxID=2419777 RepID=A0A494XAX7_9BURK|nr:hypothetical protein D7S89_15575 [Trinickia fusca]